MSNENDKLPDPPDDKKETPKAEGAPADPPKADPAPTRETDALINHPDVVAAIQKVLRKRGVRPDDLDDGVSTVQTAVLGAKKLKHPTTVPGWTIVCRAFAKRIGTSHLRKVTRRAKDDVGLIEDADEHGLPVRYGALDPIDMRRVFEELCLLEADGELPSDCVAILDATQADVPDAELAAELGVTVQSVRYQRMTLRRSLFARMRARGLAGLAERLDGRQMAGAVAFVVAVCAAAWILPGHMQSVARIFGPAPAVDAGAPPAPSAPPPSVLVKKDEKAEQVDALFAKAEEALKKENWDDCFAAMDKIARLDPTTTERMRPIYKACGDGVTAVMAKAGRDGGRAVKKRDAGRPVRDAGATGGDSGR